jgi:hypothetical protein
MTKFGKLTISVLILALLVGVVYLLQRSPKVEPEIQTPEVTEPTPEPVASYDKTLVEGGVDDLITLSIVPNAVMPKGILSYRGTIEGGYFFEANVLINILDKDKKVLKSSNAVAKTDWMTVGPVDFEGNIDFTGLPAGAGYFEIHNDNASGLPENDKSILIPIVLQ